MSYQERRALVSLVSSILITVLYTAYMAQRFPQGDPYAPEVFHFWGSFFLIFILVSIFAKIIVEILFAIGNAIATQQVEPEITDERDKLIELKADRNAGYAFIIGVLIAMTSLVLSMSPSVMFAVFLCAGLASQIIGDISRFSYYRRGV